MRRDLLRWLRRRESIWIAIALAATVVAVRGAWVTDDIFITFRYCDNVLAGHGPVYNPGERSEGYTHFLWFALLTLGRAVHVDPIWLGKYVPIPFYLAALVWLVRISQRLCPGRGGWTGMPAAMLGWALHEDARRFASGGLETAAFVWALLVGVDALASTSRRRAAWAGWAFAVAAVLRPEGLLYAALAAAWFAWVDRRALRAYLLVAVILIAPLFVFRLSYYGEPLPNPYYAKSGGSAYWSQGLIYLRTYFRCYFVLAAAVLAAVPMTRALRAAPGPERDAARVGCFLAAASAITILLVTRGGGDFMFARFFLPVTPFLLLLIEQAIHALPQTRWRLAATLALVALLGVGIQRKHTIFGHKQQVSGIVDERQFYTSERWRSIRDVAKSLRQCFAGTDARVLVQGGQAALAYFAQFPIAVERFGLTDRHIAHQPIVQRGRPGHEKFATADYLYERAVCLRLAFVPARNVPQYSLMQLAGLSGDIVVYNRPLMEHLKTCSGARFLDFPLWLATTYIPQIPTVRPERLIADWNQFQHYYFNHNPDPEGLRQRLRAALAARGLVDLPERAPPVLVQDPGLLQT
jgi:hypothetical protein